MDIFDKLDPKDGFHVSQIEVGDSVSLHCFAYQNGEIAKLEGGHEEASIEVDEWKLADAGNATRLKLFLEAAARYLTTGGDWSELQRALGSLNNLAIGGLHFEGYGLLDSYQADDGTYQHIFVKDGTEEAVLWEEPVQTEKGGLCGGGLVRTNLRTIRRQQEEYEELSGTVEDAGPDQDLRTRRQLSDLSGAESEE